MNAEQSVNANSRMSETAADPRSATGARSACAVTRLVIGSLHQPTLT